MNIRSFIVGVLAFGSLATAAPVTYTFSGTLSTFSESFTYTAPDFITTGTHVTPAQTTTCVNCGTGFFFATSIPITEFPDVPPASVIMFDAQPVSPGVQVAPNYVFTLGTFTQVGTHETFTPAVFPESGVGTLTISLAQTTTPEPASIGMMISAAVIGLIAILRSKMINHQMT